MLFYITKYPISCSIILLVSFLSLFRPPQTGIATFHGWDKVAHVGMYFVLSGMLWWEFFRAHRHDENIPLWHARIGATLCPLLFSGGMEIAQEFLTDHRGGDWWDFVANAVGVALAMPVGYLLLQSRKKKNA